LYCDTDPSHHRSVSRSQRPWLVSNIIVGSPRQGQDEVPRLTFSEKFARTICNNVDLWTTVLLLFDEDTLHGVAVCLPYWFSTICHSCNIPSIHCWTRAERFGSSGHISGHEHVSPRMIYLNQDKLRDVNSLCLVSSHIQRHSSTGLSILQSTVA
jgi:hypothetical protein